MQLGPSFALCPLHGLCSHWTKRRESRRDLESRLFTFVSGYPIVCANGSKRPDPLSQEVMVGGGTCVEAVHKRFVASA